MRFAAATTVALLAGSAIAAPLTKARQERQRKRAAARHGNAMIPAAGESGNITEVSYSTNWAGAVLIGTNYKSVTGTFVAPTPTSSGSGSAWVGIDGDTCSTAILQTGIDWTYDDGDVTYDAWYEWYPDYAYDFDDITIDGGDSITVTVTASSKTAGKAVITNNSNGDEVTHSFSDEGSEGDLCYYNAEWIVEDFESGSSLVSFADFDEVTFKKCSAVTDGDTVTTSGASVLDIKQSGTVYTSCSVPSSSEVKCTYTG